MRTLAIGDIHGCLIALKRLDEVLRFGQTDTVITLGDYVDRGPNTAGVLDYLIDLRKRCNLITLRGNHEIMMMQARTDRSARDFWLGHGGDHALDSYATVTMDDIPESHWEFLQSLLPHHEDDDNFYIHANADPQTPIASQPDDLRYWEHLTTFTPHQSGKRMVCGHTSQQSGLPLVLNGAVCIDTLACGGQWLTCMDTKTNHYWQTNQDGQLREGDL